MTITTTNNIENYSIKCYLGVVNANVVIGANLFSDFAASLTDIFGGRSVTYQNKLSLIYKTVINELEEKANNLNANAVLGLHLDFDEVSGGSKSMFMVSASGTAVLLEKTFEDRYSMYRLLNDIYDYWKKGLFSEEEYDCEKKRIIANYSSSITDESKIIKETKEKERIKQIKFNDKIEDAKESLEIRLPCSEESIRATTTFQIEVADYSKISYTESDSIESIISQFISLNKIPEACKYYKDKTALDYNDAVEYVLDTYNKRQLINKETFDRLMSKLKVLKRKGFIEQAIKEYQSFTLTDADIAKSYIDSL